MILNGDRNAYATSWLSEENLTYIAEESETEFRLVVNYPTLYENLMVALKAYLGNPAFQLHHFNDDFIRGYHFERLVCDTIQELAVICQSTDDKCTHTFRFESYSAMTGTEPVTELVMGVLYRLRPCHPTIDAVAYICDEQNQPWLLLIQVSLSKYSAHTSKVTHLTNPIKVHEASVRAERNYVEYYRSCIVNSGSTKVAYIYISPEECIKQGEVWDWLTPPRQLKDVDPNFACGLVLSGSVTQELLSDKKADLMEL